MQRAQNGDEWWLREIGALGYAVLSCDMAVVSTPNERQAAAASELRFVGFASADYDGWTQMRAVTSHWDALASELEQPGPVFIKVFVSKKPEVDRP